MKFNAHNRRIQPNCPAQEDCPCWPARCPCTKNPADCTGKGCRAPAEKSLPHERPDRHAPDVRATFTQADNPQFTRIQELVYELTVADAMRRPVVTTTPATRMSELREILRSNRISGTPVMHGDALIGFVSVGDYIKWLASGKPDCPVTERMTTRVYTVGSREPLIQAISKLEETGYGRIPVVDNDTGRLVGIITKHDVIEGLLRRLQNEYQSDGSPRSHDSSKPIFQDVVDDKITLTFQSSVRGMDFTRAGAASSRLKKTLERLGIEPQIVRRAAIASYEALMNLVIHADGGTIVALVEPDGIRIDVDDVGPGIPDIEQAMQPGYSTASEWVREMGFGAGMGLVNIKKCADRMELRSTVGEGTHLRIEIDVNTNPNAKEG